jgi:hypothetical protein
MNEVIQEEWYLVPVDTSHGRVRNIVYRYE